MAPEPIDKYLTAGGKLRVMAERCERCLFSANPLVSSSRRAEILAECCQTGEFFVCHEQAVGGGAACCKGFFEAGEVLGVAVVQIAARLDLVEFVQPQQQMGIS